MSATHGLRADAPRVEELWVYPLKSAAGIQVDRLAMDRFGPSLDRRWILLDRDGRFMSQRTHPRMALLSVALENEGVRVSGPSGEGCWLPAAAEGRRSSVVVWERPGEAIDLGSEAGEWFSAWFQEPVRVGFMPADAGRTTGPGFVPDRPISFADGYPLLVISQGSLGELNRRVGAPVDMRRFRPNVVVSGCGPHAEDHWRRVRVGRVEMTGAKPCPRCVATTVDPDTGELNPEILATLGHYRRTEDGVFFGQNLCHEGLGELGVGDLVEVLEVGAPPVGPRGVVAETNLSDEE